MGYNYTADITVTVTETIAAAIALNLDALGDRLNARHVSADTDTLFAAAGGTVLDRIFEFLDFEGETSTSTQGTETVTTFTGWASAKWYPGIEVTLTFLAEHGAAMSIDCQGEDDALWGYRSSLGGTELTSEDKVIIMRSEYTALQAAKASLDQVSVALRVRPELGVAGLLAAIEALQPVF